MLEGAFYGLDLLKLHSVTTKLVGRVDKLEEVRSILGLHVFLLSKPKVYPTSQCFDSGHIAGGQRASELSYNHLLLHAEPCAHVGGSP